MEASCVSMASKSIQALFQLVQRDIGSRGIKKILPANNNEMLFKSAQALIKHE